MCALVRSRASRGCWERRAPNCVICQFQWYKYPHHTDVKQPLARQLAHTFPIIEYLALISWCNHMQQCFQNTLFSTWHSMHQEDGTWIKIWPASHTILPPGLCRHPHQPPWEEKFLNLSSCSSRVYRGTSQRTLTMLTPGQADMPHYFQI